MRSPLPDREMRSRMVRHMESIPGVDQHDRLGARSWYPASSIPGLSAAPPSRAAQPNVSTGRLAAANARLATNVSGFRALFYKLSLMLVAVTRRSADEQKKNGGAD